MVAGASACGLRVATLLAGVFGLKGFSAEQGLDLLRGDSCVGDAAGVQCGPGALRDGA